MSRSRVSGVLGGTFDPIHLGHLQMADELHRVMRFDRLLLLLSARPPHKEPRELCPVRHREAMLRIAMRERPHLELCRLELEQPGVCYTIDSLRALRREGPHEPVFILGMDSLLELPTWRDYRQLLVEFDLLVVDRSGEQLAAVRERLDPDVRERLVRVGPDRDDPLDVESLRPGSGGRVFHIPLGVMPISSSEVRTRAARGASLDGLVTPGVARYIQRNGLYRQEERH